MLNSSGYAAAEGVRAQKHSVTEIFISAGENGFRYSDPGQTVEALSLEQMMAGINARAGKRNLAPWILAGGAFAAVALNSLPALAVGTAVVACATACIVNLRCRQSRQTVLTYRLEARQQQVFEAAQAKIRAVMSARAVWRVAAESPALRGRDSAHIGALAPPYIQSNVIVTGIVAGAETYYLLPDRLLVRTRGMFASVGYTDVSVDVKILPFTETSSVPADATVVGRTWKYTKRDGTPDRRYRDNTEFPVVQYAHVAVKADQYQFGLLVSSAASADSFAAGIRGLISKTLWNAVPSVEYPGTFVPGPLPESARAAPAVRQVEPIPLPAVEARSSQSADWVGPSDSVTVAGFRIPGYVYFGCNLLAIKGYVAEPALIDPSKPVAPSTASFDPASIPYWPSYSEIDPAARMAYLKWHASGRSAPEAPISFVFLYFYGLERRILRDYGSGANRGEEYWTILGEVRRLLEVYGGNHSFRRYASALLEMAEAIHHTVDTDGPPPEYPLLGYDLPARLKIALGLMARDGKPIPPAWAAAWVCADPLFPRRTPFSRCNAYFKELFALRYRERWGAGIVVKPNKTIIRLEYQPASASFGGPVSAQTELPDITVLREPIGKLRELGTECMDALDAYSRYLGRNPDTEAHPASMALLPPGLLAESQAGEARLVRERLAVQVDSAALLSRDELLRLVQAPTDGSFAKRDAVALAQYLASIGFGMEPDVRFGGPVPGAEMKVYLFPTSPGSAGAPTQAYSAATLIIRLAALVSVADGVIGRQEEQHLQNHIAASLHLSEDERTRLSAHLCWVLTERPSLSGVKSRIDSLSASQRQAIGRFLVGVANVDGHVSANEVNALGKLYRLLGLPPDDVYSDVHQAATGPVTVQPSASAASGFVLPKRKQKAKSAGIQMDPAMIEAKLRETAAVSALLASVFVEESSPPAVTMARAVDVPECIAGLDVANSAFLRYLSGKPAWSRGELELAAGERALLLDGSIEAINEAAFDAYDERVLEGEDTIEINSVVLSALLERTSVQ